MFWPKGYAQISCKGNELQLHLSMIVFFFLVSTQMALAEVASSSATTPSACLQVMRGDLILFADLQDC